MAKLAFSKLGLKRDDSIEIVEWTDQKIEVNQYLPIEEKANLISRIINLSIDDNGYYNPVRVYVYTITEVVFAYTNISATEKQKEDIYKIYDALVSTGLSGKIIGEAMNPYEYKQITQWIQELIHHIYEYKNSVYGILDGISADYSNLDLDALNIKEKLADPQNLELLKDVLTKLG